jgi:hypothetical protein
MTVDLFSLAGLGGILIGLIAVGALIFCVSLSAEDPSSLAGFLHKQVKTNNGAQSGRERL